MAHRPTRVEPCHHVWLYYQRKVDARRKAKLPCNQLENLMWDYSLHAGFALGVVQGAEYPLQRTKRLAAKERRRLSSARARKSALDELADHIRAGLDDGSIIT